MYPDPSASLCPRIADTTVSSIEDTTRTTHIKEEFIQAGSPPDNINSNLNCHRLCCCSDTGNRNGKMIDTRYTIHALTSTCTTCNIPIHVYSFLLHRLPATKSDLRSKNCTCDVCHIQYTLIEYRELRHLLVELR
jgi:hypothetical protein